jgi:hypothetical protein
MTRSEPDDFAQPPVDAVAQIILQDALDDPGLVKRTRGTSKGIQTADLSHLSLRQQSVPALCLLSNSDLANKRYLEDLVSIAIASAERADNILLKANATHTRTVRAVCGVASIAAAGIAAGVLAMSGLPGAHGTDEKLVAVAGQIRSLDQQQQLANHKLDTVTSEVDDQRKVVTQIQHAGPSPQMEVSDQQQGQAKERVITVPGAPPIIATPLSPLHDATYSEPWPGPEVTKQSASYSYQWPQASETAQATSYSTTLWPSRTEPVQQPSWTARHRRPQTPQFLLVIQRNLRMLFR